MPPRSSRKGTKAKAAKPKNDVEAVQPHCDESREPTSISVSDKGKQKQQQQQDTDIPKKVKSATLSHPVQESEESCSSHPVQDSDEASSSTSKMTMSERMQKLSQLRKKMTETSMANRKDILTEQSRSRHLAETKKRQTIAYTRKILDAEKTLEERDLREQGEDVERHRNFSYSIQDNENWEEKLEEKERRKDVGMIDFQDAAERRYQRQIKNLKPDLAAYNAQKAALESSTSGAISTSKSSHVASGSNQVVKREDLYRDASTIFYGDHKPSEEAIDRVVSHLNLEQEIVKKRSRRRADDDNQEINYINEKNKHFNKKIKRYYEQYTKEIRENLERGTAL